jgi:hypothetical protein
MINFFRKTRKKLADDNKPMTYARYAIREIGNLPKTTLRIKKGNE